jgi:hypothetical protein
MTPDELREVARRLLERDCAAQGIEPIVTDPEELAVIATLLRPVRKRTRRSGGGEADGAT